MKSEDIYRTILVRMWGDEKFLRLSPLPPSGQSLWIYLLAGPFSNRIGIFKAGEMALAEELQWEPKAFRKAFQEVIDEGLIKVSPKDRLVFIPNFIKINRPLFPNVVLSWKREWKIIPECPLKLEAWETIKSLLDDHDKAFVKAFIMACPKPFIKPLPKDTPKDTPIQEQEQEQEQEKDLKEFSRSKNETSKRDSSKRQKLTDEEWLTQLKSDPTYFHIDFEYELGKMDQWFSIPKNQKRKKTRAFILNWINKIDKPVGGISHVGTTGNRPRNLTFAEIDQQNQSRAIRQFLAIGEDATGQDPDHPSLPDCRKKASI